MSGMTVIVPQSLSVSASSEYGSFVADRLLTQNLGQVWQGDTYQETIDITAPAGANAIAIFGTNALSIEALSIHGYVGRTWGGISSGVDWANDRQWAPGGKSNYLTLENKILWSNNLINSVWQQDGTLDPTLVPGLDATHSATRITDDDAVNNEYAYQDAALTAPLPPMLARTFIKKQTSATVNCQFYIGFTTGGASEWSTISINAQAGTIIKAGDDTSTLVYKIIESIYNSDFWEILISATPGDAANATCRVGINPAWYDLDTTVGDATNTGSVTVGNVELYQNATIADIEGTDPLFSESTPATRDLVDTYTYLGPGINSYWLAWDGSSSLTSISLRLTGPQSERIYAGVASAGVRSSFPNPKYGLQETLKEYAIHRDNPLGSSYHRKINMAREFRWSLLVGRDRQFYQLMSDIIYKFGSIPMAWRITNISGDTTDPNRMIWGSPFMKLPQGTHAYPNNSTIDGYLREFL